MLDFGGKMSMNLALTTDCPATGYMINKVSTRVERSGACVLVSVKNKQTKKNCL